MYGLGSTPDCGILDIFNSRCWSLGVAPTPFGVVPLPAPAAGLPAPTIATVPPAAPQTEAAMVTPGVWTPDYAIYRTQRENTLDQEMAQAAGGSRVAAEARAAAGDYSAGWPELFGDMANPCKAFGYRVTHLTECGGLGLGVPSWALWAVGGLAAAAVLFGFSRGRR